MNTLKRQIDCVREIFDESKNNVIVDILEDLNTNLEIYRQYEMDGLIIRTRSNWIEHGEKPSKYFCGLEKRNYVNKNVTKLVNKDNRSITEQSEILDEIKVFIRLYI